MRNFDEFVKTAGDITNYIFSRGNSPKANIKRYNASKNISENINDFKNNLNNRFKKVDTKTPVAPAKRKIGSPSLNQNRYFSSQQGVRDYKIEKAVEKTLNTGKGLLVGTGLALAGAGLYKAHKKRKEKGQGEIQSQFYPQQYNYPQMQQTAGEILDRMYLEKLASDEVPEFDEQIPDLIFEAKYKPEIKKEETPGGKMTPSRYVQRKNKERYKS